MRERVISTNNLAESLKTAKTETSRLLRFPDGVMRHIVLPGWLWAVFDRSDSRRSKIKPADYLYLAFEHAQEDTRYPDWPFEAKIRYFLAVHLEVGIYNDSKHLRRRANDF